MNLLNAAGLLLSQLFSPLFSQRWVVLLGWTLLHFLWQGTLIAAAFAAVRAFISRSSKSDACYVLACFSLGAMTLAPVVTYLVLLRWDAGLAPPAIWELVPAREWQKILPWMVTAWFGGVLVFSARLIGGWRLALRIRSAATRHAPPEWQQALETLTLRMRTWRPVRVLISSFVDVPTVIGWLRPAILIPVSALTGLPPEHMVALLAHELAHIRRHDYVVNFLQSIAEALLFYHPGVWWVSSQIRAERELRCDDIAVAACGGDVLTYARALAEVESFRPAHATTALAANGGSLSSRIGRLIGQPWPLSQSLPGPGAAFSLAFLCLAGAGAVTTNGLAVLPGMPKLVFNPPAAPAVALRARTSPRARQIEQAHAAKPHARSAALSTLLLDPLFDPPAPAVAMPDVSEAPEIAAAIAAPTIPELAEPPVFALRTRPSTSRPSTSQTDEPLPQPAMYRSSTRLVEVEVVVDGKRGPVKGLTKDDFTLLDEGKPQSIAMLRTGAIQDLNPIAVPPGAVSNREDSRGIPWNGATVVLIDLLGARFELSGYARMGMRKLLHEITEVDTRTAVYSLGNGLHILKDFTDDPQALIEATAKLDSPKGLKPAALKSAFEDSGSLLALDGVDAAVANQAQLRDRALRLVVRHLSRVPGRKNLVWLMDGPNIPDDVMTLALEANIAIYPVLLRSLDFDGIQVTQHHVAITGGRAFFDAEDLPEALRAAQRDSDSAYVLGYYPPLSALDGKLHHLTVKLARRSLVAHYRPGYVATRQTGGELVQSPLDLTGVGLTAQLQQDPAKPGLREMHLTVDLHDVRLEASNGRLRGAFDLMLLTPGSHSLLYEAVQVGFPQAHLETALANGYSVSVGGLDVQSGELRVAVRDRSTGIAGSLRVPVRTD